MSKTNLREEILAAQKERKLEPVQVPAWNGKTVYVRILSNSEYDALELFIQQQRDKAKKASRDFKPNFRAAAIIACTCDADGDRVFDPGDIDLVGDMPHFETDPLIATINRVNQLTRTHEEELEKKFASPGDSSSATTSDSAGESSTPSA